jgi:hypothetical protein
MNNIDDLANYQSNIEKNAISQLDNTLNTLSGVYKATSGFRIKFPKIMKKFLVNKWMIFQ